jgi:hypothetical protein
MMMNEMASGWKFFTAGLHSDFIIFYWQAVNNMLIISQLFLFPFASHLSLTLALTLNRLWDRCFLVLLSHSEGRRVSEGGVQSEWEILNVLSKSAFLAILSLYSSDNIQVIQSYKRYNCAKKIIILWWCV